MNNEKLYKLEFENEKLKKEINSLKQGSLENSKKIKGYESKDSKENKENKMDWVQRMSSIKKEDK